MSQPSCEILGGDVLDRLALMPAESAQCVVTSPPYWGLRDYGVEGMIGLEPTLAEHPTKLVEVFAEVRRVLRDDGTLWLNYGDAYSGSGKGGNGGFKQGTGTAAAQESGMDTRGTAPAGLAAKQRLLMPARVAIALQDSGWWVRSEIVWAKGVSLCPTYAGSCMPSSVTDRPTDSHEMVYLLTKAPRYFYDADAVREANAPGSLDRYKYSFMGTAPNCHQDGTVGRREAERGFNVPHGRNLRTVWTINPQGYKEAHFATFPEALVRPCILAGTSERGACAECGAPWRRVVAQAKIPQVAHRQGDYCDPLDRSAKAARNLNGDEVAAFRVANPPSVSWEPTCGHADAPTRPCVVLDPFAGSGTVGAVALRHGRSFVGIELNHEYAAMARKRIAKEAERQGIEASPADLGRPAQRGLFA